MDEVNFFKKDRRESVTIYEFMKKGSRHIGTGEDCQDYVKHVPLGEGVVAFALSDGAGRADYARDGAVCNVEAALDFLQEYGLERLMDMDQAECKSLLLETCLQRIQTAADERQCSDIRQFSATLLCGILGPKQYVCMHIGDGAIYGATAEQVFYNSEPENGLYSNITYFTVSEDAYEHLRVDKGWEVSNEKVLFMATSDGFYGTLEGRGYGNPEESVLEMLEVIISKELIRSSHDLLELSLEMSEYEEEKMDDWSVIVITT